MPDFFMTSSNPNSTITAPPQFEGANDLELNSVQEDSPEGVHNAVSVVHPTALSHKVILKLLSAGFSFFVAGTIDGSLGPVIPHILRSYNIGTSLISVLFAAQFAGWLLAAGTNNYMLNLFDTGAILAIGAILQLLANLLRFWSPPFGLFVSTFFIASVGMGYQDSHSNSFVSTINRAHRWLGFIHAMYALGALVTPFVATPIASSVSNWQICYMFNVGLCVVNVIGVVVAFWDSMRILPKHQSASGGESTPGRGTEALRAMVATLKNKVVWILSLFFFFMLGTGITAGGWVVEYLADVRNGKLSEVGYIPSGLWGGICLGRLLLSEPAHRLGPRRMIAFYIFLILAFQLVFWLVPNIIASAVALSFLGFFFGPLFPIGISVGTKLIPKASQASALGFIFVVAQAGGSLFPAITGFIASSNAGVKTLQPILIVLIVAMGISWILVPMVPTRND